MRRAAVVSALFIAALPAMARPLERELPLKRDACWERTYDDAHLRANPQQKVTKIRLVHKPGNWQAEPHAVPLPPGRGVCKPATVIVTAA